MRIRLRDVAERAGVSEATVSRVMNGKPEVAATTRRDVLAVLGEMGYEPPGLRGEPRPGLVGLMLPELDNPIFPAYAQALESRLLARGYVSVLCCAGRIGASEDDYLPTLFDHGVVGLVVVSGRHADLDGDHAIYERLVQRRLPLVFVNGRVDGLDVPSVSSDETAAAAIAIACHRACWPAPMTPTVSGPSPARCLTASPPIHPVRAFVIRVPSIVASGRPVSAAVSVMLALTVGSPREAFPSWTPTIFVA